MLEVPCSRVGHCFRNHYAYRENIDFDYEAHNFKRVAEVWLDDFKEYLYKSDPKRFAKIDPGDLTKAKAVKKSLNCKPFKYMIDQIMPDMLERFPLTNPGVFAKGAIQSVADVSLCVDTMEKPLEGIAELNECHQNLKDPGYNQDFVLSWHRHIKQNDLRDHCLQENEFKIESCHFNFGNQLFYYDCVSYQLCK